MDRIESSFHNVDLPKFDQLRVVEQCHRLDVWWEQLTCFLTDGRIERCFTFDDGVDTISQGQMGLFHRRGRCYAKDGQGGNHEQGEWTDRD